MVKIRLRRVGAKKQPHYRVVVTDSRSPRDGRIIETIGYYNPRTEPPTVEIDAVRALYWLSVGAQPSEAVKRMLDQQGILARAAAIKRGEAPLEPEEAVEQALAEALLTKEEPLDIEAGAAEAEALEAEEEAELPEEEEFEPEDEEDLEEEEEEEDDADLYEEEEDEELDDEWDEEETEEEVDDYDEDWEIDVDDDDMDDDDVDEDEDEDDE